jgi:hypothetical protein
VNVGFAALTMNQDLGLSQTAFGFGAGIFFIAYFIFEVPSTERGGRVAARMCSRSELRIQTVKTVDPVVLRAARSACALAASFSG